MTPERRAATERVEELVELIDDTDIEGSDDLLTLLCEHCWPSLEGQNS